MHIGESTDQAVSRSLATKGTRLKRTGLNAELDCEINAYLPTRTLVAGTSDHEPPKRTVA